MSVEEVDEKPLPLHHESLITRHGSGTAEARVTYAPVSRTAWPADMVMKYSAGILISSHPELIAVELNALLCNSTLLKERRNNGYTLASRYQWPNVASYLSILYQNNSTKRFRGFK